MRAADDEQLGAIADLQNDIPDVPMEADVPDGFVAPAVTDKEFLLRLLTREDEVAQAKRPGQGRREALQCMRHAAEVLGPTTPWQARREELSAFGAADHERQAALVQHRALLEKLRQNDEPADTTDRSPEETPETPSSS